MTPLEWIKQKFPDKTVGEIRYEMFNAWENAKNALDFVPTYKEIRREYWFRKTNQLTIMLKDTYGKEIKISDLP